IFPLTDLEVDVFAKNREIFKKYDIVIASPDVSAVKISRSKNLFFNKLKNVSELKLIPTFHNKTILSQCSLKFPLIAKPTTGRSSEGLFKVNNRQFLDFILKSFDDYVFQEFIEGIVYTVDIVRDAKSNFFSLPRKE